MIKSELIKFGEMEVLKQDFDGDEILTVRMKDDGKIYVGVRWVCEGIGLSKGQMQSERAKIQKDLVLSKGERNLILPTKGGNQKALCIELEYLPLWLAKISITPNMKNEHPEIADKLIRYQLKAKDVLAQAFLGKGKEWDLQREVGKIDRRRLTDSISANIRDAQSKTYAEYTNMVYIILFGKTAKALREERNLEKKSQMTRDFLTNDELKLVDEAETIVTALVSLGFKKDYISDQLKRKYSKQITGQ